MMKIAFRNKPLRGCKPHVKQVRAPVKEEPLIVEFSSPPPDRLRDLFQDALPLVKQMKPAIKLMAKVFQAGHEFDAKTEMRAWRMVRDTPYFHLTPAVLPTLQKVRVSGEAYERACIVMEKAEGSEVDVWFKHMLDHNNPPFVFHQFFTVWLNFARLLEFLHSGRQEGGARRRRPFYHLDIKPDNLLFSNNLLRLIDFGACSTRVNGLPTGTARYCPNVIIRNTRPELSPGQRFHHGFFDLFCFAQTFLEIYLRICEKTAVRGYIHALLNYFKKKDSVLKKNQNTRWNTFAKQNDNIRKELEVWRQADARDSGLAALFLSMLNETALAKGDTKDLLEIYRQIRQHSKSDYIDDALSACEFTKEPDSKVALSGVSDFPKLMADVLTNYSANFFSSTYPLLYLDYSDKTGIYTRQAESALKFATEVGALVEADKEALA